jgi:photosystem II stability/assembly factor-like uncharacterized protein
MQNQILKGFFMFLFICLFGFANGQRDRVSQMWLEPETTDFKTIQEQVERYFADQDQGRGSGYKQWKRWEYLMQNRLNADGQIVNYAAHNWEVNQRYSKTHPEFETNSRSHTGYWNVLAPTDGYINGNSGYNPGIGRVNVIAFHPTSANTVFAGTPSGGLWKTTNAGSSWTPLTDGIPRIGVSGIVIQHNNSNIIYILTGDGDGGDTPSIGVLKSYDGGATWSETGLSFNASTNVRGYKLVMHPSNTSILFATTTSGLYKTSNAGADWTVVRSGSFRDIEFKPGTPSTMYATTSNSFYKSTNTGDTWSTSNSGLPGSESRAEIAVTSDDPTCIFYLAGPGGPTGSYKGLYRSNNSGDTWSSRHTSPNILDSSLNGNDDCSDGCDQSGYDLAIAVDPDDASTILTGGINVWRSTDFGFNFSINSHWNWNTMTANNLEYTHADIHELVYNPLDGSLWCGSDGGIFRSLDDGVNWSDRSSVGSTNGLQITQFYRIAGVPTNANVLIGGTQDNGSNRWNGGNDITHFDGADGMDCMIAHNNSNIQYHCRQRGGLRKSTNGGSTHSSIKPGNSNGAWVTPVEMAPTNANELWVGYRDTIYRSTNAGGSWTRFIPEFSGERFVYIYHAPSNSNRVYAATSNNIYRTDNNGSNWTEITPGLPVATTNITGITTDVGNSGDVWVTLSGLVNGQKVYYSSNSGASWTNVSGSLPNVAVNCIAYDDQDSPDNGVYVGTDIGIFYRDGSMGDWIPFRNGLPNVPVFDIEVNLESNLIRAGTFGRGIWSTTLYDACPTAYALSDGNLPGSGSQGYRYYEASNTITSTRDIFGGPGTEVYYKAGNYIDLTPGFRARSGNEIFKAWIGPCSSGVPEPMSIQFPDIDARVGNVFPESIDKSNN